jgi:hypothetical protein
MDHRSFMSRLIASILLSILLFPVAALLYLLVFFVCAFTVFRRDEGIGFILAGVATAAFVAWYWLFIWRQTVQWTPQRVSRTLYAGLGAAIVGAIIGALMGTMESGFGFFIGTSIPPLLWMVATVLVWRETQPERAERLRALGRDRVGGPGIPCPVCNYDMTGLKSTRCPECGSEFTLDELLAAQPGRAAVELER